MASILSFDIVGKCFAEDPTHDVIYRWIEVKTFVLAFRGPAKAGLEGVAVYQIELTPHNDSGGRLSRFLDLETAIFITEILIILSEEPREV